LAAKYELDPPQVAAVVASMWAKHLDRPLTARKKKRELKPNSRYDQDSIANAEAGEEEEEEEQVEAEVTPMDEDQHTPRGTKHLDDDDEDVSYDEKTGISAEVRVQVTCGDMRGTAVLPAGYKKQQEYVLHSDGKKVPPSQFERDAGKGSCKNWKNSVMVVMPDGSEGRTFGCGWRATGTSRWVPSGTSRW
jgi:protein phosphatase 1 regulatory subunit 10